MRREAPSLNRGTELRFHVTARRSRHAAPAIRMFDQPEELAFQVVHIAIFSEQTGYAIL